MGHVRQRLPGGKGFFCLGAFLLMISSSATPQTLPQTSAPLQQSAAGAQDPHRVMLSTYCLTCHSSRAKMGGLELESLDLQNPAENA